MIPFFQAEAARAWLKQGPPGSNTSAGELSARVSAIIGRIRQRGDEALAEIAAELGDPPARQIPLAEQRELAGQLKPELRQVLEKAACNISLFARSVVESLRPVQVDHSEFQAGVDMRPVASAACYAPGGRHPLPSTALMTGLAARAAGVERISLVCPRPHPAVMVAAELIGAERVYQMGGAQAIAALALGTARVEAVDMIVGPGNAYVTEAKRQLQGTVGIDMLAGPSEATIIADGGANPEWVALDLLAQAEHDPDARVVLLTWDAPLIGRVQASLTRLLEAGSYPAFLRESLQLSALLLLEDAAACVAAANRLAPEHLQLSVADPLALKPGLRHYGGLFLGYSTTVPFGDYMAGPNHTLPTGRTARFAAGLSPLTFLRPQCWLQANPSAPNLASDTARFAELEGLSGHAAAARARLE